MIKGSEVLSNNGLDLDDNLQAIYKLIDQAKQMQPIIVTASRSAGQTVPGGSTYGDLEFDNPVSNFASKGLYIDSDGVIHVDRLINDRVRIEFNGQVAFSSGNQGKTYFIKAVCAYGDETTYHDFTEANQCNVTVEDSTYTEKMIPFAANLNIPSGVTRIKLVNTTSSDSDATIYRATIKVESLQSHMQ